MRHVITTTAAAAVLALVVAACGGSSSSGGSAAKPVNPNAKEVSPAGDIPDNQSYVTYSSLPGYAIKVPEGWSRTASGGAVTFTDKLNSITAQTHAAKAPLTVAGAGRRELANLTKTVAGFRRGAVASVTRKAGKALRITYTAAGRPDPVTGKTRPDAVERYVFEHKGRDVVLTLSGPKGADNVDPWRIVTDSLRFTR